MDLGYFAADTLGMTLYQIKDRLKASEVHEMRLGPWKVDLPLEAESDVISPGALGFWWTLAKTLRLYVVIKEKECWLFVLNTKALKECGHLTGFAGQTIRERVLEIKPAVTAVFKWMGSDWNQVEYDGANHTIGG